MEVFCLAEFKTSYETLSKNNSYSNLKNLINTDLLNSGTPEKHASKLFLANIYPKTGSKNKNTIGPAEEKRLYNSLLIAIKSEQYYSVKFEKGDIVFEKKKKSSVS